MITFFTQITKRTLCQLTNTFHGLNSRAFYRCRSLLFTDRIEGFINFSKLVVFLLLQYVFIRKLVFAAVRSFWKIFFCLPFFSFFSVRFCSKRRPLQCLYFFPFQWRFDVNRIFCTVVLSIYFWRGKVFNNRGCLIERQSLSYFYWLRKNEKSQFHDFLQ